MHEHPEDLARRMGVQIVRRRLPGTIWGVTDGDSVVWLDDRLGRTEARCTLAHELVHVHARHATCQTPKVERWVRRQTATWLVPWEALWDHRHAGNLYDLADQLDVTRHVLLDRFELLTTPERRALGLHHH